MNDDGFLIGMFLGFIAMMFLTFMILSFEETACEENHNVYDCERVYVPVEKDTK